MTRQLTLILIALLVAFTNIGKVKGQETHKGYGFNCSSVVFNARGIYSFEMGETMANVKLVGQVMGLTRASGAVMKDDKFYFFNWSEYPYSLSYCTLSDTTKHVVRTYEEYFTLKHFTLDKQNQKAYCVSDESYLLLVNLDNGRLDTICRLKDDVYDESVDVQGMAINYDGDMYVLDNYGTLFSVNMITGLCTTIGEIDYMPDYSLYFSNNCLFFDDNTGKLYYRMETSSAGNELISIDTKTAAVTRVNTLEPDQILDGITVDYAAAPVAAPSKVRNLIVTPAAGGALSATVEWDNPDVTYGGSELSEITSVEVLRDGEKVGELANCVPGEHSTWIDENVDKSGLHKYTVVAINSEGEGESTSVSAYVGKGVPKPVTDVRIVENGNGGILTWAAPTSGEYDAYINPSELTYDVVRYPDETTVAKDITKTQYIETSIEVLGKYQYSIIAKTAEGSSAEVLSNTAVLGPAMTIPCEFLFEDKNSMDLWTIVDANGNGLSWTWNKGYYGDINGPSIMYYYDDKMADDWMISPSINLEAGKAYRITFDARSKKGNEDVLDVTIGKTVDVNDQQIVKTRNISGADYTTMDVVIHDLAETGSYHIGFHCKSQTKSYYIKMGNLKIEETIYVDPSETPAKIENFIVASAAEGVLQATVEWDNPMLNIGGGELSEITSVEVLRNGEKVAELTDCVPGKHIKWTDETITSNGLYRYAVIAINAAGKSEEVIDSVYVGKGVPVAASDVMLTENGEGATLTWTAPVIGEFESYINPADLTYDVIRYPDDIKVAENLTETKYTEASVETLGKYYYAVISKTAEGCSSEALSNSVVLGPALYVPCEFPFDDNESMDVWTVIDANDNGSSWEWSDNSDGTLNGPSVIYNSDDYLADDWMISPRINLEAGKTYLITFDALSKDGNEDLLDVTLGKTTDTSEHKVIKTLSITGSDVANMEVTIPEIVESDSYRIGFRCKSITKPYYVKIGNLKIEEVIGSDIGAFKEDGSTIRVSGNNLFVNESCEFIGVYNVSGVRQNVRKINMHTYDISSLSRGVYIINVYDGHEMLSVKIVLR